MWRSPGPKKFDFDVNQISITPKRAEQVDFSVPYYEAEQAVVVKKGCTDFQAVDKAIAQTRAFEKKFKLNSGT